MSDVLELFGVSTSSQSANWQSLVDNRLCPYTKKLCYKTRKSFPEIAIGTCSLLYGEQTKRIMICPNRFTENNQIFFDAMCLLTCHEPGNELHVLSEISIPGGHVDYVLVSVKGNKVCDFVGLEIQTLDTTGTIWPIRQSFLKSKGVTNITDTDLSRKTIGMNWKMTAKTILMQIHHKILTFEHIGKKLVLVIQDELFEYMKNNFQFEHISQSRIGDSMHFFTYNLVQRESENWKLNFVSHVSTDSNGISQCLGIQQNPCLELSAIIEQLQNKISEHTLLQIER